MAAQSIGGPRHRVVDGTLIVDLGACHRVLSSAPRGGGFRSARYVINHQVPMNPHGLGAVRPRWPDPARYLGTVAKRHHLDDSAIGLMTAVPVRKLIVRRAQSAGLRVDVFATVGVSNAVRAGEPPVEEPTHSAGTINLILVTNARLTSAAMVGVIQVATESKTAALLEAGVRSWTGRRGATGTGTDATVVTSGLGPRLRFSGTHTTLGAMIGTLVREAVEAGLHRWKRWSKHAR